MNPTHTFRTRDGMPVAVRPGTPADIPVLLAFIQAMADFEQLTVTATADSLRAALFGEAPAGAGHDARQVCLAVAAPDLRSRRPLFGRR